MRLRLIRVQFIERWKYSATAPVGKLRGNRPKKGEAGVNNEVK